MTEHFNVEPGSFAHKLGINKSDEWIRSMIDKCYEIFAENPGDFTNLMVYAAGDSLPVLAILDLAKDSTMISKTFFVLGFMKGVCFSEQSAMLNDLVKE